MLYKHFYYSVLKYQLKKMFCIYFFALKMKALGKETFIL